MAVTTKKTFTATSNSTTTTFGPIGIELNNQDDLDVYITESGGTRVLQYKQSSASTTDSNHPQVNDTTGLYFPPVAAGVALKNYTISADNNNVIFNSALPSGAVVSVERRTRDSSSSYTSFSSGSTIRSTDLNTAFDEARFTAQEGRNKAFDLERQTFSEDGNIRLLEDQSLIYEGATDDAYETKLEITDPTADRTITFPNVSGNVVTTGDTGTVTSTMLLDGTIVNADINASAAIAGSKLAASTTSAPGSMSAADKTKLDGIETGATADQTNAEIRAAVEAASDSNVFTDADHTKLNAIEASADVTDATNVDAAGAVMNSDLDVKGEILVGDGSGDPTALSVGTNDYVLTADSSTATGVAWKAASGGGGGAAITIQDEGSSLSTAAQTINFTGSGVTASGTGTTKTITISGGGGGAVTTDYQYLELKAHNNASGAFSAGSADYELVTKGTTTAVSPNQAAALLVSVAGVLQQPNTGTSIGSNDGFCIDGSSIHFGANLAAHPDFVIWMKGSGSHVVSDNSVNESKLNVSNAPTNNHILTADSTVTGGLKWAAAASGTPEGTAILSTGESGTTKFLRVDGDGSCSWQVPPDTTYSVQDGQLSQNNFTDADHTKLNGIEASATADQTGAEIKTAYEAESDTNAYTDAEKTKLSGIATSANNYVHPNHSGEVTSTADGATVIADNVVDEANLKVSNTPTNGYVLTAQSGNTGGLTWAAASGGGTITALNNQAANRLTTIGSTTTQLDGEASLTFEDTTSTGLISGKQITGRGFECPATVSDDWTIAAGNNAFFPGPMTVAASKTVTVPANRTLTIV